MSQVFEFIDSEVSAGTGRLSNPDHSVTSSASLEVILRNGRRIGVQPLFDRQTLLELLETLESQPCWRDR